MQALIFLGEVFLFALVLCALHAARERIGSGAFYLTVGLLLALFFVVDKGEQPIAVALLGAPPAGMGYTLFLPLLLSAVVIVYVLEGTSAARRLLIGLLAGHLVHAALDVLVAWHASHPPVGHANLASSPLAQYSLYIRACSATAFCVDFVVILVVYQALVNHARRLPAGVSLFLALMASMVADALVFSTLYGFMVSAGSLQLVEKLQVAAAAALPVSTYLGLQLRRHRGEIRRGVLERGALDVLDLRRALAGYRKRLKAVEAQFVYVKDAFSRYVSSEVVDAIMEDPSKVRLGGELRVVTVLFADIASYSTLSEALPPTDVIELLNRYFRRVSKVILARKGMINEYEGDAVLAIFGAPLDLPGHAPLAVRAALEMLDAVELLNDELEQDGTLARWRPIGVDRLAVRIGVHSGPVVAGNVGSEQRIKYAVIGDTVNTASRVEGLNKKLHTRLLVTQATAEALGDERKRFALEEMGEHAVKGRVEGVRVFVPSLPEAAHAATGVASQNEG